MAIVLAFEEHGLDIGLPLLVEPQQHIVVAVEDQRERGIGHGRAPAGITGNASTAVASVDSFVGRCLQSELFH
jgi:hypothetical protein